jgi:heme-degrading monooxygenase HmoA
MKGKALLSKMPGIDSLKSLRDKTRTTKATVIQGAMKAKALLSKMPGIDALKSLRDKTRAAKATVTVC